VNQKLEQYNHHTTNDLFNHLPHTIDHQVLHAQVPGEGNINNTGNHKGGETQHKTRYHPAQEYIPYFFQELGFKNKVKGNAKKQVSEGREHLKPEQGELDAFKIIQEYPVPNVKEGKHHNGRQQPTQIKTQPNLHDFQTPKFNQKINVIAPF
jgi:hypothetical protein